MTIELDRMYGFPHVFQSEGRLSAPRTEDRRLRYWKQTLILFISPLPLRERDRDPRTLCPLIPQVILDVSRIPEAAPRPVFSMASIKFRFVLYVEGFPQTPLPGFSNSPAPHTHRRLNFSVFRPSDNPYKDTLRSRPA